MRYLSVLLIILCGLPLFSQSTSIATVKDDIANYMSVITESKSLAIEDIALSHRISLDLSGFNIASSDVSIENLNAILLDISGVSQVENLSIQSSSILVDPTVFSKQDFLIEFCDRSTLRL